MYIRLIHTRGGMYIHVKRSRKFIVGIESTLASHLRPFPRLRMRGAIPFRPLYAFMALTGTTLTFSTGAIRITCEFLRVLNTVYYDIFPYFFTL